jgi:hypothetical protein
MEPSRYDTPVESITPHTSQRGFLFTKIVAALYAILLVGVLYKIIPSLTPYFVYADAGIANVGLFRYILNLIWASSQFLFFIGLIGVLVALVISKKPIGKFVAVGVNLGFIVWVITILTLFAAMGAGEGGLGFIPIIYFLIAVIFVSLVFFIQGLFREKRLALFGILFAVTLLIVGSRIVLSAVDGLYRGADELKSERTYSPQSQSDCSWMTDDSLQPRNSCYYSLAERTQDPTVCEKIEGTEPQYRSQKDYCYATVAVHIDDYSLCDKIDPTNSGAMGRCLQGNCYNKPLGSKEQYQCYYDAALKSRDTGTCNWTGNELSQKCWKELQN